MSETALLHDAYRLGVMIARSDFRPSFIVGLWRGGATVGIAVQECLQHLGLATDHIAVRTSYRGPDSYRRMLASPDSEIRVHGTQYLLETLSHDDGLLLVDDVYGSGRTTSAVVRRLAERLKRNMPREVRVAAPWYRPSPGGGRPDFFVNETVDWLVMPYELAGLGREEIARHKPWLIPILDTLDRPLETPAESGSTGTGSGVDEGEAAGRNRGERDGAAAGTGAGGSERPGEDADGARR